MKDGQPQEIKLSDYRPPDYRTTSTELDFDIREGQTRVHSLLRVQRQNEQASSLWLDGEALELVSLKVDGRELKGNEYALSSTGLEIHGLQEAHTVEIVTLIEPEKNTALEGLYRSSQMYCTQCEAQGFRKITYFQDRPDVSSIYTTRITADGTRYPTLLSNGNLLSSSTAEDGRLTVTWHDPHPKPSYLFALVAGNLAKIESTFVTQGGRQVSLQIFSEAHNIDQCDYAMDVLKRSMAWDEQRFGREYDLDVFMIVAVEDFNMGAMENKGLNIFNTSCVLASPDTATDTAYQRVEAVVAHEYFHNWSGNRVTCRDWFQLSLKEGFTVFRDAEFSSDMNSRAVKRIEDVTFLRAVQFAEDAGPLAHPVRPQSYIEISNFYTTTIYEKGAEVVRMYHTLIGEEAFRRGSDRYFLQFDGSAATTDDFADVMAAASGMDLSQFKRWYDQAGTPRIRVDEAFAGDELTLRITQSCPDTPGQSGKQPFHIPLLLGLVGADGEAVVIDEGRMSCTEQVQIRGESVLVHLRQVDCELNISGLEHKPVVSFLRGFSAPVKVAYSRPDRELAFLAQHDSDGFVAWDALQTLWVKHFAGATPEGVDLVEVMDGISRNFNPLEKSAEEIALVTTVLTIPDENYLFEQLDSFDVEDIVDSRLALRAAMSKNLLPVWQRLYTDCSQRGAYQPDALGMAHRGLANLAFSYAAQSFDGADWRAWVEAHYKGADNLTLRRAALAEAIGNADKDPQFSRWLIDDFYQQWHHQALVLDMWFSLQASSPATSLSRMRELEAHERFELKNPNRVRALFGAFGMYNHKQLHAPDGSGYDYLAQVILTLDGLNPQVASRITTPLTRWQRYDKKRQGMMRTALERISNNEAISKDLYEIVSKSLA